MFIGAFFTVAKRLKQPKCLLTDGWLNKMQTIQTMEFSLKKEGDSDTRHNSDESYGHCAVTKANILCDPTHVRHREQAHSEREGRRLPATAG